MRKFNQHDKAKRKPPVNPVPKSRALTLRQRRELAMSLQGFHFDASARETMRKRNAYLARVGGMYPERTFKQTESPRDDLQRR